MSRPVTISCVSHNPPSLPSQARLDDVVTDMIKHWRQRIESVLPERPDLIVLPEWSDQPAGAPRTAAWLREYLLCRADRVRDELARLAADNHTYIAYSARRIADDGTMRNSTQLVGRDGSIAGCYDKVYLTIDENEDLGLTFGHELPIWDLDFGRAAPAICFDQQFEDYRLKRAEQRPDVIIFSSAYHGSHVQPSWAYACRAYYAGSILPPAPSSIISPVGELLGESIDRGLAVTRTVNFDSAVVARGPNAPKFPAIKQRHGAKVRIHDPGRLGSVLVSSETDEFTVDELIAEFELERQDDYYDRVRAHRAQHAKPVGG
jgi:predicted amidohydrolase